MKRTRSLVGLTGAVLFGAALGVLGWTTLHHSTSSLAHAQSPGCSNASLAGSYGTLAWGNTLVGADGAPLAAPLPGGSIDVIVADGAGNITRMGTANSGGMVAPNSATATYTVNPDCTFTVTNTVAPGVMTHNLGVLVAGGTRAFVITGDAARVVTVIWERQ
jgi:hypothetical protein